MLFSRTIVTSRFFPSPPHCFSDIHLPKSLQSRMIRLGNRYFPIARSSVIRIESFLGRKRNWFNESFFRSLSTLRKSFISVLRTGKRSSTCTHGHAVFLVSLCPTRLVWVEATNQGSSFFGVK